MEWKRWRHCWQLFKDGKKVATVACKRHWKGYSVFYAYLGGRLVKPLSALDTNAYYTSLSGAKKSLEIFATHGY